MTLEPDTPIVAPPRFYRVTLAGLTYREIWRFASWWPALNSSVLKLCRIDVLLSQGVPEPRRLDQMRISPSSIREDLLTPLDAMNGQVRELGFLQPIYYRWPESLIVGTETVAAACLHSDRETFANLIVGKAANRIVAVVSFVTGYADGSFFSSGNDKAKFLLNPANGVLYLPGTSAANVFAKHESARHLWAKGRQVRRVSTEAQLADSLYDYEQSFYQWQIRRGAFIEMTAEEVESARRQCASVCGQAR
jgi:hypothetical protein